MTIPGLNSCTRQLGVITKKDILNAKARPGIGYDQVKDSQYGGEGNFFGNLKKFGEDLLGVLKTGRIISTVASAIPHPIAQVVGSVARNLGLGDGEGGVVIEPSQYHDYGCGEGDGVSVGGVPVGGRKMTRAELKSRLRRM